MYVTVKVGSITNAQRGANLLRRNGYKPIIKRLKNPQSADGCGYVINVRTDDKNKVKSLLSDFGIRVIGVE